MPPYDAVRTLYRVCHLGRRAVHQGRHAILWLRMVGLAPSRLLDLTFLIFWSEPKRTLWQSNPARLL